jgi:hypothetical protein
MRAIRPNIRSHTREHIVTIDTDSAPRVMFSGENLIVEDLPIGTRVIYPKRPMTPIANPKAAIRYALNHPEDSDPLHAMLSPGMKVTVCIDDISMPLPIMRTPDVRQLVLEIVCEMLAECTTGRSSGWSATRSGTSTGRIGCTTTTAVTPTA